MAQKLLKTAKRKIAPKNDAVGSACTQCEPSQVVLVGTYKDKQLKWIKENGVYNYPVKDGDEFDAEAFDKIRELWLYADAKGRRHCFTAEFVGKMCRDEFLVAYPTYANLGSGRSPSAPQGRAASTKPPSSQKGKDCAESEPHKEYYVFKTSFLDYGPKLEDPYVLIRAMDFATGRGRVRLVKKAFDQFKADGELAPLAAYLPSEISQVPRERLRVCEAAVQMEFFCSLGLPIKEDSVPFPNPEHPKFTFIDLFAGIGGFRLAMRNCGGGCVFSSEFDPYAQKTYEANFGEIPAGDITKQETHDLTDTQKGEIKWRLSA